MFWGLVLKTNKRYSQQVTKGFHVSQATLDLKTVNPNDSEGIIQVWLHTDDADHLLANVNRQQPNVQLDLAFTEGETVSFYSKGNGTVHLSGYLFPEDDDDFDGFGGAEEEEEAESADEDVELPTKETAKKLNKANKVSKAVKPTEEDDEEDDESDDLDFDGLNAELEDESGEEEEDDDDDDEDDDDEDDDEDDDDDDDDEEEEADSDEEEVEVRPAKQAKLDKTVKQNGLTNGKAPKKEDQKQKNQNQKQQQQQKPEKQELKHKNQQKSTQKQLSGGVIIEDIRVGKGPEAKPGKKVSVYYEGRLKSNNKVFDSTKSGEGFKFNLGRGEVIRGWDIGVNGMKVGSKRRITCPPNVAYGPKGAPPSIPGNATLVFEVELRGVN